MSESIESRYLAPALRPSRHSVSHAGRKRGECSVVLDGALLSNDDSGTHVSIILGNPFDYEDRSAPSVPAAFPLGVSVCSVFFLCLLNRAEYRHRTPPHEPYVTTHV